MLIVQMQGMRKAGCVWGSPRWTMASHDGYAFIAAKQASPESAALLPAGAKWDSSWHAAVRLPQAHLTIISSTDQLVPCSPQHP